MRAGCPCKPAEAKQGHTAVVRAHGSILEHLLSLSRPSDQTEVVVVKSEHETTASEKGEGDTHGSLAHLIVGLDLWCTDVGKVLLHGTVGGNLFWCRVVLVGCYQAKR